MNCKIDIPVVEEAFGERITKISNEEWYLPKFVLFQQKVKSLGCLNPNNNSHLGIMRRLEIKGLVSPSLAPSEPLARGTGKGKGKGKGKKQIRRGFDFESVWARYPEGRKIGKQEAFGYFNSTVRTPEDFLNINKALENYIQHISVNGTELKFVLQGNNWFSKWKDFIDLKAEADDGILESVKRARSAR